MENLRGAMFMALAMLAFTVEDTLIKLLAGAFPTWQIILALGLGGMAVFAVLARIQGQQAIPRAGWNAALIWRNLGEVVGMVGFVTALSLTGLSTASAILQVAPLVVTLGAAVFLGEAVGWRRWSAILVGFFGVMLIVRPGLDGFDASALFAVVGVIGLAMRDVATRRIQAQVSTVQLSFLAFAMALPGALVLALASGAPFVTPTPGQWGMLLVTVGIGVVAYYLIVLATRLGEVSFVTPFRYTRIVFALIVGFVVFGERPDIWMLVGTVIIIGSGLFTLWRERRVGAKPA
ncbi:MAG: DMT family transporter [Sedimentitalea sp.]